MKPRNFVFKSMLLLPAFVGLLSVICSRTFLSSALTTVLQQSSNTSCTMAGLTSNIGALAAGLSHNCAVQSGLVKCWGKNTRGQLGTGATSSNSPTPVLTRPLQ
jgi:hypothetical protein